MKTIEFHREGKKIYGELHLPEGDGRFPAVIIGHGFGGSMADTTNYASVFAKNGIAAYSFDFIGGGDNIKSDGKMSEMSVLTEAADLQIILDGILELPEIDEKNVFLMGQSQGGFVASYVASKNPDKVRGLIAEYPAYVLQDDSLHRGFDVDNPPETFEVMGHVLGKIYHIDSTSFQIYDLLPNFKRNVLLLHGTSDSVVPYSYSEKAEKAFPNAKLVRVEGADHGFKGEDEANAMQEEIAFMKENVVTE